MKHSKLYGAIHTFMFCAFFISFLFRSEEYLLRRMTLPGAMSVPVAASFFNCGLPAFLAAAGGFLCLALCWNIKLIVRLILIALLTVSALWSYFCFSDFIAFFLIVAALCAAVPLAVNPDHFDPQRLFFTFCAIILAACFPNFGVYAGVVVLITIFAQREIPGIRFGGRFILASMLFTALLFGAFPMNTNKTTSEITPEQYRKDYEMMMLAYAQYGTIPEKTLCLFHHPVRKISELSAMILKLSVSENENLKAYFAGDQLRYPAEYDLETKGKTPQFPVRSTSQTVLPAVVLVSYPASHYTDANIPEKGRWNYSFYTVEWLQKQKKQMAKNGVLALQLPDRFDAAASILATVGNVYKNTVILRWSGVYVFASDRPLTEDPATLDQNAISGGIYKYMFAPYRILLFALSEFFDAEQNSKLLLAADTKKLLSIHDLPEMNVNDSIPGLFMFFRIWVNAAPWLLTILFICYCICRYWRAGIPGAKLSFVSFETGLISGLLLLTPLFAYSLVHSSVQILQIFPRYIVALFIGTVMITLLFVHGKTVRTFPIRILMLILCACSFFYPDMDRTMLCCIALMAGVAAVCTGFSPRQYRMNRWFAGMAAACLLTPVLWYSKMYYPAAGIILCYILFAGYDNNKKAIRESGMASGADQD